MLQGYISADLVIEFLQETFKLDIGDGSDRACFLTLEAGMVGETPALKE